VEETPPDIGKEIPAGEAPRAEETPAAKKTASAKKTPPAKEAPPVKKEPQTKEAPPAKKVPRAKEVPEEKKAAPEKKVPPVKEAPDVTDTPAAKEPPPPGNAETKAVRRDTKVNETKQPVETPTPPPAARPNKKPEKEAVTGDKIRTIVKMAEDPTRQPSKDRSLQEVNTRCNLIWTSMNVRSGWSITAEDASEWFRYLTRLRYGINSGELKSAALDKFLDATLEVYKLLPENV
jgi:hypothetical protein